MLRPALPPRMKERRDPVRVGIYARKITALPQVAFAAGEGKVLHIVRAAVLAGNDVFDMQRDERRIRLATPAILATVGCSLANRNAEHGLHRLTTRARSAESGLRPATQPGDYSPRYRLRIRPAPLPTTPLHWPSSPVPLVVWQSPDRPAAWPT